MLIPNFRWKIESELEVACACTFCPCNRVDSRVTGCVKLSQSSVEHTEKKEEKNVERNTEWS